MKAKHLNAWLRAATREKDPDIETWDKVVSVIQVAFREGFIPKPLMWTTMILITKGKFECRCIGLVETIWRVCTSIVNSQLRSSIVFRDALHGFI